MYRIGSYLVAIVAIFIGLLIGTLNSDPVRLDLLWVQLDWPLGLLIVLALSVGLLLGMAFSYLFQVLPLRYRKRKLEQAATRAESPLPTTDD